MYSAVRAAAASRRIQMCPCFSCREPPRQPPRVLKLRHTNDHRRCPSDCDRAPPRPALDTAQSGQARRCKSKTMLFLSFFFLFFLSFSFFKNMTMLFGFLFYFSSEQLCLCKVNGVIYSGLHRVTSPSHSIIWKLIKFSNTVQPTGLTAVKMLSLQDLDNNGLTLQHYKLSSNFKKKKNMFLES